MAADSPEKFYLKSPLDDSTVKNLSFSMDSLQLGDSTRSLLSPLYDREGDKSFHYENDKSELSEGEFVDNHNDNSRSSRSDSFSENDHSGTETVKKGKIKDSKSNSYSSRGYSSSNRLSSTAKSQEVPREIETELSPWEKWLLNKVIEDHERTKAKIKKKRLEEESNKKEMAEKLEKERKAEQEWLELKTKEERKRNKLRKKQERIEAETKLEEQRRLQEQAEKDYRKWNETKENERKERIETKRKEKLSKKQEECVRRQKNEEAYEKWLEKAKKHPKLTKTHYGYLSGRVTGYYDWTCYPMPSYTNPNPWVGPKVKRKHLPVGKIELQNPSPPLLFKELEQREQNSKQKNSKLKVRKDVC